MSTKKFWKKESDNFPYLSKLANILLNINASSSFIERYFSICGIICDQRSGNMSDELICNRCMLKANMPILNQMNKK